MTDNFYTQAPYTQSHSHFGNRVIESFPDLHAGASFKEKGDYIRDSIKYQILTTKPEQAKRYYTLRECFKFTVKSHVEHCLNSKAPGVTLNQAAKQLGYRKI